MADSSEHDDVILPDRYGRVALELWRQSQQRGLVQVVGGNSMAPLIRAGDLVLVERSLDDIRPGAVVVFQSGDELITHRVISVGDSESGVWFITKGDNALWPDPPVPAAEIIGRVLSVKRGERQMSLDTALWSAGSRLVALIMLLWVKTAGKANNAFHRNRQSQSGRLARFLSRITLLGFNLLLRTFEMLFGRWRR
jgi:signal peptidase